jgi:hypothetical protein
MGIKHKTQGYRKRYSETRDSFSVDNSFKYLW